jgi:hypothetical protein
MPAWHLRGRRSRRRACAHPLFPRSIFLTILAPPLACSSPFCSCGHLYCWPCLYRWLRSGHNVCPVCKAGVTENVIPLYGRGKERLDPRSKESSTSSGGSDGTGSVRHAGDGGNSSSSSSSGGSSSRVGGGGGSGGYSALPEDTASGTATGTGSSSTGADLRNRSSRLGADNATPGSSSGGGGNSSGSSDDAVPSRPAGQRMPAPPPPGTGLGDGTAFGLPGGLTFSAGFGFFPSLFGLQFTSFNLGQGGLAGGGGRMRGVGGQVAYTPEERHQLMLERVIMALGFIIILFLLFL